MKRPFFINALIALSTLNAGLASANEVVITGNVSAIPDSTVVTLFRLEGQMGTGIAMDTVYNGKFQLIAKVDSGLTKTDLNLFKDGHASWSRMLYLRPDAKIEINSNDQYVQTWEVVSNVLEQIEYDRFISNSKDLLDQLQQDNDFIRLIQPKSDHPTAPNTELNANKSLRDSLNSVVMLRDIDLLKQMPVSTVWFDKIEDVVRKMSFYEDYSGQCKERLLELYQNLNDEDKNSRQGIIVNTMLNPPSILTVGDYLPNGIFFDIEGNRHSLSELKGKWILLDFWSRGCGPCIMAIPELHEFEEKHMEDVAVVSLSIDNDKMWREASETYLLKGNNWNEGKEDMGLYQNFGAQGLPTFVLIAPDGKIKSTWCGYGKGIFERYFKFYSRIKDKPEYLESNGVYTIRLPKYESNQTDTSIDVERIELSDEGTTLFFSVNYIPGWWISISPNSYLMTNDGTKHELTGSEGITPGEHFFADENGSGYFSLTFKPVPQDTQSISFYEGPDSDWTIEKIRLR